MRNIKIKKGSLLNLSVILGVLFFSWLSIYLLAPPTAVPTSAPLTEFSAERAMTHVNAMCQKPHSIGTPENREVREYILGQVHRLGLDTHVQSTTAYRHSAEWNFTILGQVHNVVARLKGTGNTKSILIMGHYDSQFHTPGAADDGSATSAMLETARALLLGPPLKNDVIFLFTDGEETGMLGAKAFVDEHPLAKEVGLVLNLEGRGNHGASLTFQVSPQNGWIMEQYAKAVPYPIAASIMYEVYSRMPNDTDFSPFLDAGYPGFNTAFVEGVVHYHSMTDTPGRLSSDSIQHHGSYALSIARHFGNLDLTGIEDDDVVFFNPIGTWFVKYPAGWNLPLVLLVSLLYILYIVLGIKKQRLTIKGIIGGFPLYLLTAAGTLGIGYLLQSAIRSLYPHYDLYYASCFFNVYFYFAFLAAMSLFVFSGTYHLLFKKLKPENLFAGFLLPGTGLMIFLYIMMPTGAYIFIFPLLSVLIAGILCFHLNLDEENKPRLYYLIRLFGVIPAVVILSPYARLMFITFGLRLIIPGTVLLLLLFGFLLPQFKSTFNLNRFAFPLIAFLAALLLFLAGHLTSGTDEEHPLQTSIHYRLDAQQQKASWVSNNLRTDKWNSQFFTDAKTEPVNKTGFSDSPKRLVNQAPYLNDLPMPVMTVHSDTIDQNKRIVELTLSSPRRATIAEVSFKPGEPVSGIVVDGKLLAENVHTFSYCGELAKGMNILLECDPAASIGIIMKTRKRGLPAGTYKPMPPDIIPRYGFQEYVTIVEKVFTLPGN